MIRTIIVDDEPPARGIVREYLSEYSDMEIVSECANGFEAVKAVTELNPDLIFLDIQMPKINGFEVIELLPDPPAIIFVTAFDEFALKAFEVNAVDYLLKPFSKERFREAVSRVRERDSSREKQTYRNLMQSIPAKTEPLERLLIKDGSRVHIIPVGTIDFIEAKDDYISINAGGKAYLKQKRLGDVEKELDAARFVRTHRSYIVNVECIVRIELYAKDSRIATLRNGSKIPISRSRYDNLKKVFN